MSENCFNVKGIFLDLDGTIVDSTQAYFEASQTAYKAIGQEPLKLAESLQIPKRLEQGQSISSLVNGDTKQFLGIYLKSYYLFTKTKTKPLPEISATLENLSKKAKLALITMRHVPRQSIIQELERFDLAKYFSHIVTAMDTEKPKPSPEALIKCVKALDVDICDCIIAGDSVNDVRAGKAAGAKTVALLSGLYFCEELAKEQPDLILPQLCDLPKFIK
jgi:HAD superfamily hydrolase (TIGR01509 family)